MYIAKVKLKVAAPESGRSIQDSLKLSDLESSSRSKLDKNDSRILSAIEKKKDENSTEHSRLISADDDQLMEHSRLISHIQDCQQQKSENRKCYTCNQS